jgi:regulator of telomere elongation helicase 1
LIISSGFQVLVGVVTHGPDGTQLDSSYKNRSNSQYVQSLGRTIRSTAQVIVILFLNLLKVFFIRLLIIFQVVPDGLLVFFPSYPVMKACQEAWQLSGLWDAINQVKPIFVEPNSKVNN